MKPVYIVSNNITAPLGWNTAEVFAALLAGRSGIALQEDERLSGTPFQAATFSSWRQGDTEVSLDEKAARNFRTAAANRLTRFEQLAFQAAAEALQQSSVRPDDAQTVFILATTKGNVALLEHLPPAHPDLLLHHSARKIAAALGCVNPPLVVSHACVSGLAAILLGKRLLESGRYRHAAVCGADEVSRFVLSGFQSFQALSDERCRPFDRQRKGLNLGEGGAAVILSTEPERAAGKQPIRIRGGALSNDANHISGPSRTGAELSQAIDQALAQAGLRAADIGFISAHGTATPYNDEMEAKAFDRSGLNAAPLNSLKAYFGHTLGAAGLIETVVSAESLRQNKVIPTLGFEELGVSRPVNVCREMLDQSLEFCLKTASGFGGCNGALVLGK